MNTIVSNQRTFFNRNTTKNIAFRIEQLKKLKHLLQSNEAKMEQAIFADFSKSAFDNYSTELALLYAEIDHAIRKLPKWSAQKRVWTDLVNLPAKSYILPEPLGVTLVIGAWNYPYQLSFAPAIAAIAAGNTVVLKPSELPANTSKVMAEIVNSNFDPAFFHVVEGGINETQQLLEQRFDKIFFTGSVPVGRIVYQAAAKHLTPVTLELGGKSPAIILDDISLDIYAKRLVWAKFLNAGQTCIAPDYILVKRPVKDKLIASLKAEIEKSGFSVENNNYVQIISSKNGKRLQTYIDKEKVVMGGNYNDEKRIFEPTIMDNVSFDDAVMQEEIFGPILPVLPFDSLDEVIAEIKRREKPLACYIFTDNKSLRDKILKEVSFGGGCVNDALMHISNSRMPFGGVGESGIGSYHGEYGFKTFTHYKSVLDKPTWLEPGLKYAPNDDKKMKWMKKILK